MQITNDNQQKKFNDPAWYFLAEYPLDELWVGMEKRDELMASSLFQAIRDLDMPSVLLHNIKRELVGFAGEALAQHNPGGMEPLVSIRLFCQRQAIAGMPESNTIPHLTAEPSLEVAPVLQNVRAKKKGGWGYFMIKRNGGIIPGASRCIYNLVDLYLYKEGAD